MLDDCKGPRFEEVLAALSTSVIYKALAEDESDTSIVRQILLGKQNMTSIDTALLSMSYRALLTKRLSQKAELSQQYRKFGRMLDLKSHEIEERGDLILTALREWTERSVPKRTITKLTQHLSDNWRGDRSWIDELVQGDRFRPRNSLLERPFDKIWRHASNDTLYEVRPDNKKSLLEDLEGRVLMQNKRIEKWKQIKQNLDKETKCANQSNPPYFNDTEKAVDEDCQQGRYRSRIVPSRYKPHTTKDDLHLRESFNEATYQDEKSRHKDVQHLSRPDFDGTVIPGSFILPPHHESQPPSEEISGIETPSLTTDDDSLDTNCSNDCIRPKGASGAGSFGQSVDEFLPRQIDLHAESKKLATLEPASSHAQSVIAQMPLSLAERTRMSMALASPSKVLQNEETQSQVAFLPLLPEQEDSLVLTSGLQSTGGPCRSASLIDRTRLSMSLMSTTSYGRRQSFKPRVSKVYPVNQFNSPGREQSSLEPAEASILEEILPDAEADYESVFKSRPKIALSPGLKPVPDSMPYSA